ncbi:hypothetical protein [Viridibacillus arvi]|uniref:hypothetical protein n=1 Tax=Viridibacillus arvi TaxID=263475 RepID=UPI0034CEBEF3
MSNRETTISVNQLYEWRKALENLSLVPSKEIKGTIVQINDRLEEAGVRHLESRYFIITNPEGNAAGEWNWIVQYDPRYCSIQNDMIEVSEEFSNRGVSSFTVPLADLTEITKKQYEELSYLVSDGDDPSDLIKSILNNLEVENEPTFNAAERYSRAENELMQLGRKLNDHYQLSDVQSIGLLARLIEDLAQK